MIPLHVVSLALAVGSSTVPAQAVDVEEVRFEHEGATLAASLYLPEADRPLPGIVMIHGSGESDRSNTWARTFAEELSAHGYAVLFPDKRGSGDSEGDWRRAGFELLAGDATAGAATMRRNPAVDGTRVGYLGLSQGGHVAPLAARTDPDVAFVVNVVGALRRMEDTLYDGLELAYRSYGLSDETIEYLQDLARYSFDYIKTGEGWEEYLELHREIGSGPLSLAVATWPTSRDDPYWTFWRKVWDYDPMPHWRHLVGDRDVPSLVIYGTDDRNVMVDESLALAAELEPDPEFRVRVYEGAGHSLWDSEAGGLRDDMLRDLAGWLREVSDGDAGNEPLIECY